MSATEFIEELDKVKAEQDLENSRPPIQKVKSIISLLTFNELKSSDTMNLELCVFSIKENPTFWKIELIDAVGAICFATAFEKISSLQDEHRKKFIFGLTLWKPKGAISSMSLPNCDYQVGKLYTFKNVYGFHFFHGSPQASLKLSLNKSQSNLNQNQATMNHEEPDLEDMLYGDGDDMNIIHPTKKSKAKTRKTNNQKAPQEDEEEKEL